MWIKAPFVDVKERMKNPPQKNQIRSTFRGEVIFKPKQTNNNKFKNWDYDAAHRSN
jgi:hypothetical protein